MYRAIVSFVCADFSMVAGELRNIDSPVAKDLLNAGYIEVVKPKEVAKPKEPKKVEKKPAKKKK